MMNVRKKLEKCPECGGENLAPEGRCLTCLDCGWAACSV
jgi:ribosomal protein S27AE